MEMAQLVFFFSAVIFIYALLRRRRANAWPWKAAGTTAYCPHPNPVVGNTLEFIRNRGRFLDWYTDMLREAPSNTIEAWGPFGASHALTTADPAGVDHLLCAVGAHRRRPALDPPAQAASRSLRRFTQDVLAVHLRRRLLPSLDAAAAAEAGSVVDLQEALRRFAFDTICHVAFGVDESSANTAVQISFMRTLTPYMAPVRRLTKLLNVGKSRRLAEAIGVIDA